MPSLFFSYNRMSRNYHRLMLPQHELRACHFPLQLLTRRASAASISWLEHISSYKHTTPRQRHFKATYAPPRRRFRRFADSHASTIPTAGPTGRTRCKMPAGTYTSLRHDQYSRYIISETFHSFLVAYAPLHLARQGQSFRAFHDITSTPALHTHSPASHFPHAGRRVSPLSLRTTHWLL